MADKLSDEDIQFYTVEAILGWLQSGILPWGSDEKKFFRILAIRYLKLLEEQQHKHPDACDPYQEQQDDALAQIESAYEILKRAKISEDDSTKARRVRQKLERSKTSVTSPEETS